MATIHNIREGRRGCGYRAAGGLYLRADGISAVCGLMPIPLDVCPACHGGIKPSRGWTWINLRALTQKARDCKYAPSHLDLAYNEFSRCEICPARTVDEAGLLWIGAKYYATPRDWIKESDTMGVSRRISAVPKNFKLGETWVAVAHRKAIESEFVFGTEPTWTPAIFHLFKPERIEYVVRGNESEKTLDKLEGRGLTLVKVEQI